MNKVDALREAFFYFDNNHAGTIHIGRFLQFSRLPANLRVTLRRASWHCNTKWWSYARCEWISRWGNFFALCNHR